MRRRRHSSLPATAGGAAWKLRGAPPPTAVAPSSISYSSRARGVGMHRDASAARCGLQKDDDDLSLSVCWRPSLLPRPSPSPSPSNSRRARKGGASESRVGPAPGATSAMAEPLDPSGSRGFRGRRNSPGLLQAGFPKPPPTPAPTNQKTDR
jgi:hypothetical protein